MPLTVEPPKRPAAVSPGERRRCTFERILHGVNVAPPCVQTPTILVKVFRPSQYESGQRRRGEEIHRAGESCLAHYREVRRLLESDSPPGRRTVTEFI